MTQMKPVVALDADGVLLDYHQAYRHAWRKAFGGLPELKDVFAYWPIDRWNVRRLEGDDLESFRRCFDYEFWSTIPAISSAVDPAVRLQDAGYELVCVSAVNTHFQAARLQNLRECGLPIERVIATANSAHNISPKASALNALRPVAFVDDYLPYLSGISSDIHSALVLREPNGSPNIGEELVNAHSQHRDLADFVHWWLTKQP